MNRDEATKYFWDNIVSYKNISERDIWLLEEHIKKTINDEKQSSGGTLFTTLDRRRTRVLWNGEGFNLAELYVNGINFKGKIAITFTSIKINNDNNYAIGLCGWANENEAKPIIEGFINWIDKIKWRCN